SPPPFTVGIERICSDDRGSAPGPITNKKGEYVWRLDVDPLNTRACFIRATHEGYASTRADISALNGVDKNVEIKPLVIMPSVTDPYIIAVSDNDVPPAAKAGWKAAMKAVDAKNLPEAGQQIEAAVQAAPKFSRGWHALGVVYDKQRMMPKAKEA